MGHISPGKDAVRFQAELGKGAVNTACAQKACRAVDLVQLAGGCLSGRQPEEWGKGGRDKALPDKILQICGLRTAAEKHWAGSPARLGT